MSEHNVYIDISKMVNIECDAYFQKALQICLEKRRHSKKNREVFVIFILETLYWFLEYMKHFDKRH